MEVLKPREVKDHFQSGKKHHKDLTQAESCGLIHFAVLEKLRERRSTQWTHSEEHSLPISPGK